MEPAQAEEYPRISAIMEFTNKQLLRRGSSDQDRIDFSPCPRIPRSLKLDVKIQIINFVVETYLMISRTVESALRAVVMLGSNAGSPRTTREIAKQTRVSSGYLSKVLQALGRAGLVEAQRGLYGGFVLARPLNELTIRDVINAIDPLERIERCPLGLTEHGNHLGSLHRRLDQGIAKLEALFRGTTIGQLLAEQDASQPLCGMVARDKSSAHS